MKTVSFSLDDVEPLGEVIVEFLMKNHVKNHTPEEAALIVGALRIAEMYFMETLQQVNGTITMGGEEHNQGH